MTSSTFWKTKAFIVAFAFLALPCSASANMGSFILKTSPPGEKQKVESEHRPKSERSYWLNAKSVSPNARAFFVRADGATQEIPVKEDKGAPSVTFKMPMEDGPAHGANNIYLVDKEVSDKTLVVKTAKKTVIQHSCGWGHGYKHNEGRMTPRSLDSVPLEIVCNDMWNGNFHVETQSGSNLDCKVLSYGKPASGAKVDVTTRKGWVKKLRADDNGTVRFQLIRDYYPDKWTDFKRRYTSGFLMTAKYNVAKSGELSGEAYDKVQMVSTFPWRYAPSRRDYSSYSYGLTIGIIFMIVPAIIVYVYRERRKRPFKEVVFDEKA